MYAVCINVNGIEKVKQRNSENVTEKIGISSASVHESVCCIVFSIYSDRFELNVPNPARIVKCVHIENSENTKGSHITPPKRCTSHTTSTHLTKFIGYCDHSFLSIFL